MHELQKQQCEGKHLNSFVLFCWRSCSSAVAKLVKIILYLPQQPSNNIQTSVRPWKHQVESFTKRCQEEMFKITDYVKQDLKPFFFKSFSFNINLLETEISACVHGFFFCPGIFAPVFSNSPKTWMFSLFGDWVEELKLLKYVEIWKSAIFNNSYQQWKQENIKIVIGNNVSALN